jgi:ribosome biogenesis GTPase / thiamine phosphate phosphatase
MRALSVAGADDGVEQEFQDLERLAASCEFTDCSHDGEQGCAVAAALSDGRLERSRFESWQRLRTESAISGIEGARRDVADRKRRKAAKFAERRAARL